MVAKHTVAVITVIKLGSIAQIRTKIISADEK
jgi:hypothetical protein